MASKAFPCFRPHVAEYYLQRNTDVNRIFLRWKYLTLMDLQDYSPAVVPQPIRTFGQNMREQRLQRGITQEQLAEKMGYERQNGVSKLETSESLPEPATIKRVAKAIGCTPADLLAGVWTEYDVMRGGPVGPPAREAPHLERRTIKRKRAG
jgi:transcriptional regulator with XRE-family HTH domain